MKIFVASLLAAAFLAAAVPALAADKVVSVSFASIAAMVSKGGEKLDPRLFSFGKAVPGTQISQTVGTNGLGRSKKDACRWALLSGFLKFQRRALKGGDARVYGVRTVAGDIESAKPAQCLCLAGGIVVRSVIKGTVE